MQSSSAIFSAASETLPYPPVNQANTSSGVGSPYTQVLPAYARDLFIRWIGLQLAVEIGGRVPWSVTSYNAEQLQVLFDSAAIMTRIPTGNFTIATGSAAHPNYVQRNDNLGESMIAPPWFTFAFLKNGSIVGGTRLVSIGALLQWCSANLAHFYGAFTYQETENHWQYRGNPPITSIINGTTNPTLTSSQFAHWTAGCHGTTGFIRNVLRAINIPVHISIVCGHSQSVFITENLYLDHGDDPYNQTFKATGLPASQLLIDQATYVSWFGSSTDNRSQGCNYIGHQVTVLAGP
jgi:hypothetical protein